MRDSQLSAATCDGWPFLIGPGYKLGVRVVVAPDPLYASDTYGALLAVAKHLGNPTSFGYAYVRNVTAPDGHPIFIVVYQTLVATEYFTGGQSDTPLADRGGRPIHLTEGLVLRPETDYMSVTGSVLYAAHSAVVRDYASYWGNPSETFIATSNALGWETAETAETAETVAVNPAVQFHILDPVALDIRRINWPKSALTPVPTRQPEVAAQSVANQTTRVPNNGHSGPSSPARINGSQVQPVARDARQNQESDGWFMRLLRSLFSSR